MRLYIEKPQLARRYARGAACGVAESAVSSRSVVGTFLPSTYLFWFRQPAFGPA
jgi:hypothetical protein